MMKTAMMDAQMYQRVCTVIPLHPRSAMYGVSAGSSTGLLRKGVAKGIERIHAEADLQGRPRRRAGAAAGVLVVRQGLRRRGQRRYARKAGAALYFDAQIPDEDILLPLEFFLRGRVLDLSLDHEVDAVGERQREWHLLLDEQDRHPLLVQLLDDLLQAPDEERHEARGRLIQHQDFRLHQD